MPHVSVSTRSSDLCFTCLQNALAIQNSGCLPEEEKFIHLESAKEHLCEAKTKHDYYKSQVEAAEGTSSPRIDHYHYNLPLRRHTQIHLPFDAQQTGLDYFKTA